MRHPYKYRRGVDISYAFTFTLDLFMACVGLLMYGDGVKDEITRNILLTEGAPEWLSLIIVICVAAFLADRVGQILPCRISGVQPFGFFATVEGLGGDGLVPAAVEARFKAFSPAAFSVEAAGKKLAGLGADRHKVLEMVAAVTESDEEIDLAEDRYIRTAALAMGLSEAEFRDLVVDFNEIDELEGILGETLGV